MNVERVPGHRLIEDAEHVVVQYTTADGQPVRAEFERNATELTFATIVAEGDHDLPVTEVRLADVPLPLRNALGRRGYDVVERADRDESGEADAADAGEVSADGAR